MADQSQWPAQNRRYPAPAGGRQWQQKRINPAIRAATADRERVVEVLKAAFAEGRLTHDEFTDRVGRAYEAKTYGDLAALTADLPAAVLASSPSQARTTPRQPATNSWALVSMVLGLSVPLFGLTAIPAVITGHVARQQIRETGEQGSGMATAGIVLGYLAIIAGVLALILVGLWSMQHGFGDR